ncbi:MAG: aminoacyl-tRNA deacylase [Candidatus Micrarchaeia archaeon]
MNIPFSISNESERDIGFKTIILKSCNGFLGAMIPVAKKLDLKEMRHIFSCKTLNMASRSEVKELTGFEAGGVCPLFAAYIIIADKSILNFKKVSVGSGSIYYDITLNTEDVIRLSNCKIISLPLQS